MLRAKIIFECDILFSNFYLNEIYAQFAIWNCKEVVRYDIPQICYLLLAENYNLEMNLGLLERKKRRALLKERMNLNGMKN